MMKETMSCGGENYDLFFLTIQDEKTKTRIQQASAKLRNVFVKALLWC